MFSAIILSGGSSQRMGGINKQLAEVGGIPVFVLSALKFQHSDKVGDIIIAAPEPLVQEYDRIARSFGVSKLKAVVSGGSTRFLSVMGALAQVSEGISHIAIHDGARPLIETHEIDRVLCDAERFGAAIAAIPATDTVKISSNGETAESTPPRESLFYAQTPQAFELGLYKHCVEQLGEKAYLATDDSCLAEQCGKQVHITVISGCNMKITRPEDLAAANAIYACKNGESDR